MPDRHRQVAHGAPRDDAVREVEAGKPIEDDIREQVEGAVEKREEADHPPEPDDGVPPGETAQRRHRQRDAQKPQRPDAGLVGDVAERVRAEMAGQRSPQEPRRRDQTGQKDRNLQCSDAVGHGHSSPMLVGLDPHSLSLGPQPPPEQSEVLLEIHSSVQARDLRAVSVEHQRFAFEELADAALGRLAPPWMIDLGIHV